MDLCFPGLYTFPPNFYIQSKMSSIKQLIVNAIIKVSEANPAFDREGGPTHDEARDDFIKRLLAELFPEDSSVPVPKTKKTAAKKTKAEEVVVTKTEDEEPVPQEKVEEPAPAPKKKMPKKVSPAPAEAPEQTTGSNAAAGGGAAPAPAEPVKEKKARKPKPADDSNLAKIDPTWRKHLKAADKEHAKELEPELLKYLNALSKDDFNAKKAEEHVADFVAARAAPAAAPETDGKVEADLAVVDFNGKEYFVNPETKRVYEGEGECDADGNWTNYKPVGYVGMAAFTEMKLD
jgi:hypothetical protein